MRVRLKALFFLSVGVLLASIGSAAHGQISIPGFGQKNAGSNDQKANALLHQNLPLDLDANSAYPTVPNEDLLGGPFRGRVLPITLNTLTKPLPPGDYVLPMTFFCSEYSIHRPGAGTAYVLAPAKGTAAKAISTLLWRGMLTGHKPQELQSVSWAIQGSVAYDKMPANYKRLVDELIPDMKNQVNGQAFADIETGFQGKVNRATKKISDAIGKGTGGHVHADIKVDVELNQSFGRLGRLGKMALDGESINSIVTDPSLTDEQRTHALYAGQGTQGPPLPAANGPWSVIVPGVAYMRFTVHGGNLQGDNVMQIRILKPRNTTATLTSRPHLVLAQYPQGSPAAPSLPNLFGGGVNQTALAQCQTMSTQQGQCALGAMSLGGLMAFSVGTGDQAPIMTPTQPLPPVSGITATPRELIARVGENRTTIGVGEIVDLSNVAGGSATWSIAPTTAGCLTVSNASQNDSQCQSSVTASSATFTAFDQDGTVEVTATQGRTAGSLTLTIVKPQKVTWLPFVPVQNPALPKNLASPTLGSLMSNRTYWIGALGVYYVAPDTVSFSRIRIRELNEIGKTQGTFKGEETTGHCGKYPEITYCNGVPIGSIIRQDEGSRALYTDDASFHDLNSRRNTPSILNGSITYDIPVQFSVRRPQYSSITVPVDNNEVQNTAHWGSYDNHDLNTVEQQLTFGGLSGFHVRKGDAMTALPSFDTKQPSYLACHASDNNPLPLVVGATKTVVDQVNAAVGNGVQLVACKDLCTWEGEGTAPHCDTQNPQ